MTAFRHLPGSRMRVVSPTIRILFSRRLIPQPPYLRHATSSLRTMAKLERGFSTANSESDVCVLDSGSSIARAFQTGGEVPYGDGI